MAKPVAPTSNVTVRLDQWADGPVAQGDVDGTGNAGLHLRFRYLRASRYASFRFSKSTIFGRDLT